MPLVTSHSRDSAAARSPQMSRPTSMTTVKPLSARRFQRRGRLRERVLPLPAVFGALLQQLCDDARPSGLMTRTEPGSVIAVEILEELHVVAPVRIPLEGLRAAINGSPS